MSEPSVSAPSVSAQSVTERVPVMVLTGYSDAVERARDAGAQEVLLKPFEKNVFVKKVLQLLQDSPPDRNPLESTRVDFFARAPGASGTRAV